MVLAGCFEGCHLLGVGVWGFEGSDAGLGEGVEAHVTPGDGPFVLGFGEESSDETDDGVPGGEDPDDVGAAAYLFVDLRVELGGPVDSRSW